MKIGIVREGKVPIDRRVALNPNQAKSVEEKFDDVEVVCQPSDIRCYPNEDYENFGVKLQDDLSDCDVILGVKEVPIPELIADKTYLFFSHTIKKQPYNRELLRTILHKNITLIDYETLVNEENQRIIAFGRYAGIVGAYNGIWTYGQRYNLFNIRRANECLDLDDLKTEYKKVDLPKIKIVITGGGRVAKGAMEVFHGMGLRKVSPADFLEERFDEPVFTQLSSRDYNRHKEGHKFDRGEFYQNPAYFDGDFLKYAAEADILIASAYWSPQAPVLFTVDDVLKNDFNIKIIADITCDIEGSIPSTKRPSTIDDPVYDFNPTENKVEPAFNDEGNITVMAVDNLPCELPRNASTDFGEMLLKNVLPGLIESDDRNIIKNATIASKGKLTERYNYLQDYVDGK